MQVGVCCFHVFAHNSQRLSRGLQDAPAHSGRQHGTQLVEPLSPLCVRNHGEYEGNDSCMPARTAAAGTTASHAAKRCLPVCTHRYTYHQM